MFKYVIQSSEILLKKLYKSILYGKQTTHIESQYLSYGCTRLLTGHKFGHLLTITRNVHTLCTYKVYGTKCMLEMVKRQNSISVISIVKSCLE